jgi:hypothetical protein
MFSLLKIPNRGIAKKKKHFTVEEQKVFFAKLASCFEKKIFYDLQFETDSTGATFESKIIIRYLNETFCATEYRIFF